MKKIAITADSSCDIGDELKARYNVELTPLTVRMNEHEYTDGVDINSKMIFDNWDATHTLPSTVAVNPDYYSAVFKKYVDQGMAVIHVALGSGLSSCCQNANIAAAELPDVYVIDSKSLSSGCGHIVCEVGERIKLGMEAADIVKEVTPLTDKVSASFIIDKLNYLAAGGRCSNTEQVGAAIMNLHPGIKVVNDKGGSMVVGKKYMGKFSKCIPKYVEDQLAGRTDIVTDKLFITCSSASIETLDEVREQALKLQPFLEVFYTYASCTITAHCGPNTIGVLFMTK
ncbi:MAG TPA: DegV family protein [Eubacteriales bacterium]|nr:DegV family protein [Clostridia bacterium]HRV73555.1 DegV family protein [Eubacteriales bacterium]